MTVTVQEQNYKNVDTISVLKEFISKLGLPMSEMILTTLYFINLFCFSSHICIHTCMCVYIERETEREPLLSELFLNTSFRHLKLNTRNCFLFCLIFWRVDVGYLINIFLNVIF